MNPLVISIITTVLNDRIGLERTWKSIERQTQKTFEWVVWDGDSVDGTVEYLAACKTSVPFRWESGKDSGIYDGMNRAFSLAQGKYCLFLNAGDELEYDAVFHLVEAIQSNPVDLILFDCLYVDGSARERTRPSLPLPAVVHRMPAVHQAIVFLSVRFEMQSYDPTFRLCGDYDLLARWYLSGASWVTCHQVVCRHHAGGATYSNPRGILSETWRIQRDTLQAGLASRLTTYFIRCLVLYYKIFKHRYKKPERHPSRAH